MKDIEVLNVESDGSPVSLKAAHRTLAHVNKEKTKEVLTREKIKFVDDFESCEACIQGKMHRASYRTKPKEGRATGIGTFHADLCSPATTALGGFKHFLCFTDDYSKYRKVYFLKTKDAAISSI